MLLIDTEAYYAAAVLGLPKELTIVACAHAMENSCKVIYII